MESRSFLYSGENILLGEKNASIRITCEQQFPEYFTEKRIYHVPSTAKQLIIDYLEFIKNKTCSDKYCLTNVIGGIQEKVLKTSVFPVYEPFSIKERITGNHIEVSILPEAHLSIDEKNIIVSINGFRMKKKNKKYTLRVSQIEEINSPLSITIFHNQISYTKALSCSLPKDFLYLLSVKTIKEKKFVRLSLFRNDLLSEYSVDILNPVYTGEELIVGSSDIPYSAGCLAVSSSTPSMTIIDPDQITELFFEVLKEKENETYMFCVRVNGFLIFFKIKFKK
ncbi:hypothetical protein NEFER03_2144 [Nematocida sp. LUAm3]|nr:hypothetical protein NEFER03_2144 [Nematocida sp. LUAm3]KAI5174615.1 hypothetical protein NEFER02_0736 [Nematocida sp. LUAm2]KAI5177979.1 hypothetical protein NEFER01_1161 [Nematocida sp. LUAm1]